MNRKIQDEQQGEKYEQEIKNYLESHLNINLSKTGKYDYFDFVSGNNYFEIKSRNCNYETYPTSIISLSKVMYAKQNSDNKFFFIFVFSNCTKFIEYDSEVFDSFKIERKTRRDRGKEEINSYIMIPIQFLKDILEISV